MRDAAAPADEFRIGLNYWPADTAMSWWSSFDLEAARADLARIAAAGFGYLRFFLLWEAFQPEPDTVSVAALRSLEAFADAAARVGVRLQPTLFTGHMSGANWLPAFATAPAERAGRFPTVVSGRAQPVLPANFYADERLLRAQELLAREAARALARHPAVWSWDLGNEHSNVATPATRDDGRRWLARMVAALRAGGSEHPVTIGLHMEDLEEDRQLGPREAAEVCDYLCMHGYPFYARWARDPLDIALLPFLGLVTRWLGGQAVLFQEFGLPTPPPTWTASGGDGSATHFSQDQGVRFYRETLAELRRERFLGAFAWCAFDYAEQLWDRPPLDRNAHERFFGLFRADGSAKPIVEPWRELRGGAAAAARQPARGTDWIDITPEAYWRAPARELRRLFGVFVTL